MLRIGLTGGIGSGKTTVAQMFEVLGIPVFYADDEAKKILNEDEELKKNIIKNFGKESYANEKLNRAYLASVVFNDKEKLDLLNSLTHPATLKAGEAWMKKQTAHYAIHEAALIFEAGVNKRLDYVIGVYSPLEIRIKRVMTRDNATHDEIMKRINRQMIEEEKMKRCDFVLTNNEEELLIPQVIKLHEQLLKINS